MLNNPINYTDPSGHDAYWCETAACQAGYYKSKSKGSDFLAKFGITTNLTSFADKLAVYKAALLSGKKLAAHLASNIGGKGPYKYSPEDAFASTHGQINITILGDNIGAEGNCETSEGSVTCHQMPTVGNILHEFGHAFDNHYQDLTGSLASDTIPWEWNGDEGGYMCPMTPCMAHSDSEFPNLEHGLNEEFADMYMNWVLEGNPAFPNNGFNLTVDLGVLRSSYMNGSSWWPSAGIPNWLRQMSP